MLDRPFTQCNREQPSRSSFVDDENNIRRASPRKEAVRLRDELRSRPIAQRRRFTERDVRRNAEQAPKMFANPVRDDAQRGKRDRAARRETRLTNHSSVATSRRPERQRHDHFTKPIAPVSSSPRALCAACSA